MKQYLLSIYQPEGDPPPPEVLERVMRDVDALNQELKAAGAWVFAGGIDNLRTGIGSLPDLCDTRDMNDSTQPASYKALMLVEGG